MEYLSSQCVLLPLVYGLIGSLLWPEFRDSAAWQATSSWAVYLLACHQFASMAPGEVCHGPQCSLAGLDKLEALGYLPCRWPGVWARLSQCVQPLGCGVL